MNVMQGINNKTLSFHNPVLKIRLELQLLGNEELS